MKQLKMNVEFNIILSTIKLSNGEELLGHVATPITPIVAMKDVDFDKFYYVFYPSKVSYVDSEKDNKVNIRLSSWGELFGTNIHPIPKSNCISVTLASKLAENIYNGWFEQKYNCPVAATLKSVLMKYFNMVDLPQSEKLPELPHVYTTEMFSELPDKEKSMLYSNILATYQPFSPVLN